MKSKLILALFFTLPFVKVFAEGAANDIVPVGSFSSIAQDAEHCNGNALDIWQEGSRYLGVFHTCAGLTGDTVAGVATITRFDAASNTVAFEGTLSRGTDYLKGGAQVPSKDHFAFTGTLTGDEIAGELTWIDDNYPTHKPRVAKVRMRRASSSLPRFATESDWSQYAASLTKVVHAGH